MNTHNKESVQQRLQMSYGHTEPYIVSYRETNHITGKNDPTLKINRLKIKFTTMKALTKTDLY